MKRIGRLPSTLCSSTYLFCMYVGAFYIRTQVTHSIFRYRILSLHRSLSLSEFYTFWPIQVNFAHNLVCIFPYLKTYAATFVNDIVQMCIFIYIYGYVSVSPRCLAHLLRRFCCKQIERGTQFWLCKKCITHYCTCCRPCFDSDKIMSVFACFMSQNDDRL